MDNNSEDHMRYLSDELKISIVDHLPIEYIVFLPVEIQKSIVRESPPGSAYSYMKILTDPEVYDFV